MRWKRLTHRLGPKLLSLVMALALWLGVTNQIEFEKDIVFPIRYADLSEKITPLDQLPEEVRTRVRAKGRFLAYRLRGAFCRVDLAAAQVGHNSVVVTGGNMILPDDVAVTRVEILEPRSIAMEFDETVIRDIPIHASVTGVPEEGHVRVGKTFVNPTVARVRGPRRLVDPVALLTTEEVSLEGARNTLRRRVALKGPEGSTVEVTPESAEVGITIEPIVRQEVASVAAHFAGELPPGMVLSCEPPEVALVLTGARSLVEVTAESLSRVLLRAGAWREGAGQFVFATEREALALVPENTTRPSADPDSPAGSVVTGPVQVILPLPPGVSVAEVRPSTLTLSVGRAAPDTAP
ncbi:MAG: YbbR-like domain-containing protein [Gemmatimonadota bacterium]|nr:YbbR-like domain-containing protein [Gemmatimonadota bacterium]